MGNFLKAALGFATGGVSTLVTGLFGSSENGKGVVNQVSNVVDQWMPSDATLHKQNIENMTAGDASQASARLMQVAPSHDSWFDVFIDGLNRSVRPFFTYWAMGVLAGWWAAPKIDDIDPFTLSVIWTIIGFWFGGRMLVKDLPKAMAMFKASREQAKMLLELKKQLLVEEEKKKAKEKAALEESTAPFEDD